jgi:N-methylhydantoinase B
MEGLVDDHPVREGEVIRIRTTGGGGWGDPLARPAEKVAADVRDGKVSAEGARGDYGVVLRPGRTDADPEPDLDATAELRTRMRAGRGPVSFFDRGPGYATLAGGRTRADVDDPVADDQG